MANQPSNLGINLGTIPNVSTTCWCKRSSEGGTGLQHQQHKRPDQYVSRSGDSHHLASVDLECRMLSPFGPTNETHSGQIFT